jgi:glycosyltransferase involved in cell wall biosynthesis
MRILYFTRGYTTHDHRFLTALAASRHHVLFLPLVEDGAAFESRPLPAGVERVPWPGDRRGLASPDQLLTLMPEFQAVLDRVRPDLVHAGPVPSCGFMAALAAVKRLFLMSWGSDVLVEAARDPLAGWASRHALARADVFVCDCDAVRAWSGWPAERVVQFPWGVDLTAFQPGPDAAGLRASLGWEGCPVVVSCRAWAPDYGVETVVEAFRQAQEQESRLRLLLLGHGPLEPEIRARLAGLEGVVHAPGLVPEAELPAYFHAADVYLSATPSDGSSISLLQAMACGLPPVVADAPGNREWVQANGLLAPAGDAVAFAAALLRLVGQPLDALRAANRAIAEARADWPRNVQKLIHAYDRMEAPLGP